MSDNKRQSIADDVNRLRDERDSIFRNLQASTNASEKRSLQWAWDIKQAQLRSRGMDLVLLSGGML